MWRRNFGNKTVARIAYRELEIVFTIVECVGGDLSSALQYAIVIRKYKDSEKVGIPQFLTIAIYVVLHYSDVTLDVRGIDETFEEISIERNAFWSERLDPMRELESVGYLVKLLLISLKVGECDHEMEIQECEGMYFVAEEMTHAIRLRHFNFDAGTLQCELERDKCWLYSVDDGSSAVLEGSRGRKPLFMHIPGPED